MREARRERADRLAAWRRRAPRTLARASCVVEVSEPSGACSAPSALVASLQRAPVRVLAPRPAERAAAPARRVSGRPGRPVDDVQPQRGVVELADAVVAEQV